jgi:hypothetical protein
MWSLLALLLVRLVLIEGTVSAMSARRISRSSSSGMVERHTDDDRRNGTLSLFAALEVATGQVTNQTRERHAGPDFLAFLRLPARTYPRGEVHVVLDNVSTHKTPDVVAWLAKHPRFHVPLHPDLGVLDEPGRDLVRHPDPPDHPARRL